MPPAVPRNRRRISLLSLLLITTCVALGLGVFRSSQHAERYRAELSRALAENRRLRDEYGAFTVEDPGLLYAASIDRPLNQSDYLDWEWRVRVPEGKRSRLKYGDGIISTTGFPAPTFDELLDPGEHTIRLEFHFDPKVEPGGVWWTRLGIASANARHQLVKKMSASSWPGLLGQPTTVAGIVLPSEGIGLGASLPQRGDHGYTAEKPLVLQRLRVQTVDASLVPVNGLDDLPSSFDQDADAPGFLIWLEPLP